MTNVTQISAYSCPYCNKVSTKESIVQKCILKHEKQKELDKKKRKIEKFINDNYVNIFKKNLVPIDSSILSAFDSLRPALITAAASMGHILVIKTLNLSEIKKDAICFRISGDMSRDKNWKFPNSALRKEGILKKDFLKVLSFYHYTHRVLFSDYTVYFSEFASAIGIETHSGGGGQSFSYEISLRRRDFPNIDKEIEEYLLLKEKRDKFLSEKKRLINIYEKERLPSVLISDVSYAVMSSDLENLQKKQKDLLIEINELSAKIAKRKEELYQEDSINIQQPDDSYSFDAERYNLISNYANTTRRI